MDKLECKHNWIKFFMFGIWWYACLLCGKMAESDAECERAEKQVRKKTRNNPDISKRSEIQFWEEFIPYAIEKGILTKEEASSLNGSLYNYSELMAEKSQLEEK